MIFYSVINLRWLSPFVGVCYEHVSWDVPYSLNLSPSLSLSLSDSSFSPRILLCPVEPYDFSLVVPLRFSLIISLPNFLPRYRFDALLPVSLFQNHLSFSALRVRVRARVNARFFDLLFDDLYSINR